VEPLPIKLSFIFESIKDMENIAQFVVVSMIFKYVSNEFIAAPVTRHDL
jgi:hypothetical protein